MLGYYSTLSSEVYDMDKPIGRSFGDVEFYSEKLKAIKGKILEPAVGTGRILIPLLEKGMHVDGFDISTDMLNLCRENCEKRNLHPILFEAQMESLSLDTEYEAIIVPTGSFLLLHKREESLQALKIFHQHLSDGGRLIIDIFLQGDIPIGKPSTKSWKCDNGDVITLEQKNVEVDYVNQYSVAHHKYEKWRCGKLIQLELERFPLRWYGVEEFRMILQGIGFGDITISADYNERRYPTSAEQVVTFDAVAVKG